MLKVVVPENPGRSIDTDGTIWKVLEEFIDKAEPLILINQRAVLQYLLSKNSGIKRTVWILSAPGNGAS